MSLVCPYSLNPGRPLHHPERARHLLRVPLGVRLEQEVVEVAEPVPAAVRVAAQGFGDRLENKREEIFKTLCAGHFSFLCTNWIKPLYKKKVINVNWLYG